MFFKKILSHSKLPRHLTSTSAIVQNLQLVMEQSKNPFHQGTASEPSINSLLFLLITNTSRTKAKLANTVKSHLYN